MLNQTAIVIDIVRCLLCCFVSVAWDATSTRRYRPLLAQFPSPFSCSLYLILLYIYHVLLFFLSSLSSSASRLFLSPFSRRRSLILFLPLSSSRSLPLVLFPIALFFPLSLSLSLSSSLSLLFLSLPLPHLPLSSLSLSSLLPRLPHFFSFLIFVLALAVYVDEREREEGKSARIAICITFLKTHHQNVNRNSNLY